MLYPAWSDLQEAKLFLCPQQPRLWREEEQLRNIFPCPPEGLAKHSLGTRDGSALSQHHVMLDASELAREQGCFQITQLKRCSEVTSPSG